MRRTAGFVVAAAAIFLCVGCSQVAPDIDTQSRPALVASQQLEEALAGSQEEMDLVANTHSAFADSCMAEAGFTDRQRYAGGGSNWNEGDLAKLEEARLDNWWGVSLPQYAQKYGYHEVETADFVDMWTGSGEMPPSGYNEAATGAEYLAGETDQPGGCLGQWYTLAYDGVAQTQDEMMVMAEEIRIRVREASRASDTAIDASRRWSQYMADQGYSYDSPHAALADFVTITETSAGSNFAWKTPSVTDEEIQIAVIDAQCKVDVGFWDAIKQAENDAAETALTTMRPQIETLKQANDQLAKNAAKILATLKD